MNELIGNLVFVVALLVTFIVVAMLVKFVALKWFDTQIGIRKANQTAILGAIVLAVLMSIWTWPNPSKSKGVVRKTVPVDVEAQQAPVVTNSVAAKKETAREEATQGSLDAMEEARNLFNKNK